MLHKLCFGRKIAKYISIKGLTYVHVYVACIFVDIQTADLYRNTDRRQLQNFFFKKKNKVNFVNQIFMFKTPIF